MVFFAEPIAYQGYQSFIGKAALVNLWDEALDEEVIKNDIWVRHGNVVNMLNYHKYGLPVVKDAEFEGVAPPPPLPEGGTHQVFSRQNVTIAG